MAQMGSPAMGLPQQATAMTPPSLYMLQWHEHHASFFRLMEELCQQQSMTDVTVACGDVSLEAHSIILSASSPLLRSILAKGEGKKQTIHFMDMNPFHMQLLLQYMYRGEISVPQSDLGPLMQSAKALQIKGLSGGNSEEKISEFASYLAQQQQQQVFARPPAQPQQQVPLAMLPPTMAPTQTVTSLSSLPTFVQSTDISRMTPQVAKKRKSRNPDEIFEQNGDKRVGLDYEAVSPDNNSESKLLVKPRKASKNVRKKLGGIDTQHEVDEGGHVKLENEHNGEVGAVVDEEVVTGFDADPFPTGSVTENWNNQHTMKAKGHRIPVLPKPLSQMKTTETRSYLSRLIWATNGWKRPQYGNPETKPIWWPDELLKWSEMKKMGGKKADGLSNVNYNEIQKNILSEGYKYFGFDPETLCDIVAKEEKEQRTLNLITTGTMIPQTPQQDMNQVMMAQTASVAPGQPAPTQGAPATFITTT